MRNERARESDEFLNEWVASGRTSVRKVVGWGRRGGCDQ